MELQPFFSIIIPVYQCEKTITACIESVLLQEEKNIEIILVDDGTKDNAGNICDRYSEKYPDIIKVIHKENEGPLLARIDGIVLSTGKYIMFLDSDDQYCYETLKCMKDTIEEFQADLVIFNHSRIYNDGTKTDINPVFEDKTIFDDTNASILRGKVAMDPDLNALWNKCVKREILEGIESYRMFGKMRLGEDKVLSMMMVNDTRKAIFISKPLYEYRILPDSISRNISIDHYKDLDIVYCESLKYLKQWKLTELEVYCHKTKIEYGIACLNITGSRVIHRMASYKDYYKFVKYVMGDSNFWKAFKLCKKHLSIKQKIICLTIKSRLYALSFLELVGNSLVKRI